MTGGTGVTTVDGCRIAYRRAGTEGPPVVLLHGGGVDDATLSWRHTLEELAEGYQVYAPSWPGYGESMGPLEHTTDSYVSLLEGFLESVGLEQCALAGISMGGAAALGFALEYPQRVERLTLVGSYGLGERIPVGSFWKTVAHVPGMNALGWNALALSSEATRVGLSGVVADPVRLSPEFVEDVRSRARRSDAGRAFEAFQRNELAPDGTVVTNYADDLESLTVPTLLVHGAEDPLFPARWSRRAADRLPDAELAVLEDCGHWPTRERPEVFNAILREFLE
ncbi:alpha/beta fold hydrolase [Natronobeatus ordinarius]|uniref:alpha/beta fold hydrolase n=1 Tax=Natronobeatus ordinarius TaxID=2963433 RepID=UPI0020CEB4E6|nr:alpha/beta fold hydrolase [Natronobeatus ordinarius]